MNDAEYIQELEGLACFLATVYNEVKQVYYDAHLETCSSINPNRRELTDAEMNELLRFPAIQGFRTRQMVDAIAKANKPTPKSVKALLERFTTKKPEVADGAE